MKQRKWKVFLYILGILLAIPAAYIMLGSPSLTPEMAMRRAERAHLVGPAKILGTEDIQCLENGKLIIGQTSKGYVLYPYTANAYEDQILYYQEKTGDITVAAVSTYLGSYLTDTAFPIVVFDDCAEAVRAEMDLLCSFYPNEKFFEKEYFLESQRHNDGYFLFSLPFNCNLWMAQGEETTVNPDASKENTLLMLISETLSGGEQFYGVTAAITVRLYDRENMLILEKTMEISSYEK